MNTLGVVTTVMVPSDVQRTWTAITDATALSRWMGRTPTSITTVAQEVTVSMGEASFYRWWVETVEPPRLLRCTTAYLGLADPSVVTWQLEPVDAVHARVRVEEVTANPEPSTTYLTQALWQQRLADLSDYLAGRPVAQAPQPFERSVALSAPTWRPLHPTNLARWLPVSGPSVPPHWFYVVDELGSRPLRITSWQVHYDDRLVVKLASEDHGAPTRAEIDVSTQQGVAWLRVRHTGWEQLAADWESSRMLRCRCAATWACALAEAAKSGGRRADR